MNDRSEIMAVHSKAVEALRDAVENAGGEYANIDFEQARTDFLATLTPKERDCFAAMEHAVARSDDADRRTAQTVNLLRNLGAVGVPEPDPLQ